MKSKTILVLAVVSICALPAICLPQSLVPIIRLSPAEVTRAKQAAQNLEDAETRSKRAVQAWRDFLNDLQAQHRELPKLQVSSDFKIAIAVRNGPSPFDCEAVAIPLSNQEQDQASSLYREMEESRQGFEAEEKRWRGFQLDLISAHFPAASTGFTERQAEGRTYSIPIPWGNGAAFTPDYQYATPAVL